MEVYFNICSEYSDKQIKRCASLVNESAENHGLFQKEISSALDSHLKEINCHLQRVKTRNHGFQLLLPIIEQGSLNLIGQRSELWFGACVQAVSTLSATAEKINACKIITIIVKAASKLPELHKYFITRSHATLIQSLATADATWNLAALECLYELIKLTAGQCLPQKTIIEENMLKYLDTPLTKVGQYGAVERAGMVYAALPLPGMGGNRALGRAEARGKQLSQLLALAHDTMDALFQGVVERERYNHKSECTLKITPIKFGGKNSSDAVRGFLESVTRLGNILKFVSQLLGSDSVESISVVPYHILSPLFRLLQVDSTVLKSYKSQEHQILSFLIVSLHHQALLLLRDIVMSIGEGIDLYYGIINELLTSVIKRSFSKEGGSSGVQTRIVSYSVLSTVLQVSRGRHSPSKEIVALILIDVLPRSDRITLQNAQGKGPLTLSIQKKKKKKGYTINETAESNQGSPLLQCEALSRVTKAALVLAETLIVCSSHCLPQKARQTLQMNVLKVAEAVASGAHMPEAYLCCKTRVQLYQTLACLATHPDPRYPPPYTMILHLLKYGQQDKNVLVVTTCQALIGNVSFILSNPQISEMATALQYSRLNNGQELEDEEAEVVASTLPHQKSQMGARDDPEVNKVSHNGNDDEVLEDLIENLPEDEFGEGFDVGEEAEFAEEVEDEEEEDDNNEEEEEEDDDDNEEEIDEELEEDEEEDEQSLPPKEGNITRNGINGINEAVALDEEELELAEEDGDTPEENGHAEMPLADSISENKKLVKEADSSKVSTMKSESWSSTVKRKNAEELHKAPKHTKHNDNKVCSEGPSLEEMLNSFVDADPDDE